MQMFQDSDHCWWFWLDEGIFALIPWILLVFDVFVVEHKQLLSPGSVGLAVTGCEDVVWSGETENFVVSFFAHFC